MRRHPILAATLSLAMLPAGAALAQTPPSRGSGSEAMPDGAKHVRITYENMTTGQGFSPPAFMAHNVSAPPLFKMGEKASFGLMRLAEEGNPAPLLDEAGKMMGQSIGMAATGLPTPPGRKSHEIDVMVTRDHPMISGAWMLGMTNDGFTGISGVNAYEMKEPMSMELMAMEAGTEKNNEKKDYLIAMMGTERDPEGSVVQKHAGIRGDADAPASWKFDPAKPVARITITPMAGKAASR